MRTPLYRIPLLLALLAPPLAAQASGARVDAAQEPLLAAPGGARLATVLSGAAVTAGNAQGALREVTLEGWVPAASLRPNTAGGRYGLALKSAAALRSAPDGGTVARLNGGMVVAEVERRGTWVRIRRSGWVRVAALSAAPARAAAVPARPAASETPPRTATAPARPAAAPAAPARTAPAPARTASAATTPRTAPAATNRAATGDRQPAARGATTPAQPVRTAAAPARAAAQRPAAPAGTPRTATASPARTSAAPAGGRAASTPARPGAAPVRTAAAAPAAAALLPGTRPAAARPAAPRESAAATRPPARPGAPATSAARRPAPAAAVRQPVVVHSAPNAGSVAVVNPDARIQVLGRQGEWTRVRIEGWTRSPVAAAGEAAGQVTLRAMREDPDAFTGREVDWQLRFVSLQNADAARSDLAPGEPYMLARDPNGEAGYVYVAVPAAQLAAVRRLVPFQPIRVAGRVRVARSPLMGHPIVDLVGLR